MQHVATLGEETPKSADVKQNPARKSGKQKNLDSAGKRTISLNKIPKGHCGASRKEKNFAKSTRRPETSNP